MAPMLLTLFLMLLATESSLASDCELHRVNFNDAVLDYGTYKYVIKTLHQVTAVECFEHCISDCSCMAYQLHQNIKCHLLYEDRESAPQEFKVRPGYNYYHLERAYKCLFNSCTNSSSVCSNSCCASNPCRNGGTCTELCGNPRLKFRCTCSQGYAGRFCNKKPESCKDYLDIDRSSKVGEYSFIDPSNHVYRTFCDFGPENGMAWTLVESFTFSKNNIFNKKPFYKDYAVNEATFNWISFRLSLSRMTNLIKHSTHFRATCNDSPSSSTNYTDYFRAKTSELNLMTMKTSQCFVAEYFSVAGASCSNCKFTFYQNSFFSYHPHIDCFYRTIACRAAISIPGCTLLGQDLFGFYSIYSVKHGCTASPSGSTKWWFGS